MTFKECQQHAINEAMELNKAEGFFRWKSVSMSRRGDWFADECSADEMEISLRDGFFLAPCGFDHSLKVAFRDTPICDWDKSLASVPH